MWNCSLRVQMSSLRWLQRSVQDSYIPRVWVSVSSEGEASSGVLSWETCLLFILSKVFTSPLQPQLSYPREILAEEEHVLAAKEPEVEVSGSV